eukprot:4683698-Amphidinium_carterae.1
MQTCRIGNGEVWTSVANESLWSSVVVVVVVVVVGRRCLVVAFRWQAESQAHEDRRKWEVEKADAWA